MRTIDISKYDAWISPNYHHSQIVNADTDLKINVFYDRIDGWQLHIAEQCCRIERSGCAVLSIVFSYFEMIATYINGKCSSNPLKDFKNGFLEVFPDLKSEMKGRYFTDQDIEELLNLLYSKGRSGLYHRSMAGPGIVVYTEMDDAVDIDDEKNWLINPHEMVRVLRTHLKKYVERLKSDSNLRQKFERRFSSDDQSWGVSRASSRHNLYGVSLSPKSNDSS